LALSWTGVRVQKLAVVLLVRMRGIGEDPALCLLKLLHQGCHLLALSLHAEHKLAALIEA
jgi:hypothetical protein